MAIGFNLPGIPGQIRGTPEEAGAMPDLGQAMMQGFRSNIENVQGAPRLLSQQLLSNALSNKIRGVQAKYAEPMAKTRYDQALANLQHQGLINQYYGRMRESELSGQGLTQQHQRMVNDMLKRQIDRQKRYDELMELYQKQGATPDQAHTLATQAVDQTHPVAEQAPAKQPMQDLAQTILGAQMPDYLANIAPQGQQAPADIIGQNVLYSPMEQANIGLRYTPVKFNKPEQKQTQDNWLRKMLDQQNAMRGDVYAKLYGIQQPPMPESNVAAQGYESVSPIQSPELRQKEAMAQAFQLPASAQPAPEYLQRPEETAMALPEAQAAPTQAPAQAVEAPAQQFYAQQLQEAGFDTTNSNPVYAAADQVYLKNPNYRDLLKQEFPNIGIKQFNDFPRNRMITTETLPSGATRTRIMPLGGAEGGAPEFKPSSPAGKLLEDLHHYERIGDKKGIQTMENAIKKSLESGKLEIEQLYDARDKNILQGNKERADKEQELIDDYNNKHKTTVNIQPRPPSGATIVNDDNGNYAGYLQPLSKKQIEGRTSNARFNVFYDVVSNGVKPYQGTPSQVYNQLKYDIDNQDKDQAAADRLHNLALAQNVLTSVAASELNMIDAPKVKNVMAALKSALGKTGIPSTFDGLVNTQIHTAIQNKAQDDTGLVLNMATDAYNKALDDAENEKTFVPARANIKDLQGKIYSGANGIKAKKKTKPIVLKSTPKGLEKDHG